MPDKYGFDHLPHYGTITVLCSEKGCDAGGYLWEWKDDKRRMHFLSHSVVGIDENNQVIFSSDSRTDNCRICGESFQQERKRGRPRVLCYVCKPKEIGDG